MIQRFVLRVVLLMPILMTGIQDRVSQDRTSERGEASQQTKIVPEGATVEKVATGFRFTEGPAMDSEGSVLFSAIPNNRIMKYSPRDGQVSLFREPSGRANGLIFDAQGRLLACEGNSTDGGRRVSRTEKNGKIVSLADSYNGRRLNSPNDLCIDGKGRIYFTDPRYGDRKGVEQDKEAVYRIDPNGKVTRIIDDVQRPNGIVIAPDDKTLYVADNNNQPGGNRTLNAYDIRPDSQVTNKRVLHDFAPGRGVDGMKIDIDTDALQARIRKQGYVSGIAQGSFLDKRTGAREAGFGLHIMDFLLAPGWRDDGYSRDPMVHGNRPKHYVQGPQVCTQAKRLRPEVIQGKGFVAVRLRFRFTQAAPALSMPSTAHAITESMLITSQPNL